MCVAGLLRQDTEYFDGVEPSDLQSALSGDADKLTNGLYDQPYHILSSLIGLISEFTFVYAKSKQLALMMCIPTLMMAGYHLFSLLIYLFSAPSLFACFETFSVGSLVKHIPHPMWC